MQIETAKFANSFIANRETKCPRNWPSVFTNHKAMHLVILFFHIFRQNAREFAYYANCTHCDEMYSKYARNFVQTDDNYDDSLPNKVQVICTKSSTKLSFTRCKKDFLLQVNMRLKNKSKLSSMINQNLNPPATGDFYILLHKMHNFMFYVHLSQRNF